MAGDQRSETELRSTGTHKLDIMIEGQRSERAEEKHRDPHPERDFMAGSQRSERAEKKHRDSHPKRDFMAGYQR